jgi:D-3-phosphoglycerate dehydrogenase
VRTERTPRTLDGPLRHALVLEHPDPSLDQYLADLGIEVHRPAETPTEDELIALLQQRPYQLLFKRSRVPITRAVLAAAPDLVAVMLCCIGDDSVDKKACADHGVLVFNDPKSNGRSVAEMVLGEIICLSRRLFEAATETNSSRFLKSQVGRYEVHGKKLGIIGLGNIGRQVAKLGRALGMHVLFHDNREVSREVGEELRYTHVRSIRDLFAACDIVTAHISAYDYRGASNENLITFDDFAAMSEKEHDSPRIFLNAARGNIHTSDDLVRAVDAGHIRAAMVDVFPSEPNDRHEAWVNPYADNPNILATPHIGASTLEAQPRIAEYIARSTELLSAWGILRECVYSPRTVVGFDDYPSGTHILTVVHSSKRGTKRAIDNMIYTSGASSLQSAHKDFDPYGFAYHVLATSERIPDDAIAALHEEAERVTGEPNAIRLVRRLVIP